MWNPDQYHLFQAQRSAPFFDLLSLIQKEKPFGNVVDLGCGTGELTQQLHKTLNAAQTWGVDSSPSMLEKAKQYSSSTLVFEQKSIEEFSSSKKFDLIFSNAALQWCEHHALLLKKFYALLDSEGQLAVQVPSNHDYATHTIAHALSLEAPYVPYCQGGRSTPVLKIEEYARILRDVGFVSQHVREQVYGHELKSREDVIEWVKGTTLTFYEEKLPSNVYENFLAEYKVRLFKVLPNEKPFFYPFKRILMWAKR